MGRQVAGSLQERVLAGTVTLILATPTSLVFESVNRHISPSYPAPLNPSLHINLFLKHTILRIQPITQPRCTPQSRLLPQPLLSPLWLPFPSASVPRPFSTAPSLLLSTPKSSTVPVPSMDNTCLLSTSVLVSRQLSEARTAALPLDGVSLIKSVSSEDSVLTPSSSLRLNPAAAFGNQRCSCRLRLQPQSSRASSLPL